MSPSSTVHGVHHDTKYATFELLMHAAFVAAEIWGIMHAPARIQIRKIKFELKNYDTNHHQSGTTPRYHTRSRLSPSYDVLDTLAGNIERLLLLRYSIRVMLRGYHTHTI